MAVREYIRFAGDLFPNDSLCWKSPVIDGGEYAGDDDPRLGRSCRRGVHASSLKAPSGSPLWTQRFFTPRALVFSQKG